MKRICMFLLLLLFLTGCQKAEVTVVTPQLSPYEKKEYETIVTAVTDVTPETSLDVTLCDSKVFSYEVKEEGLVVKNVYVTLGQTVKKGDTLVSFESDELTEQKTQLEAQREQSQAAIRHLKTLLSLEEGKADDTREELIKEEKRKKVLELQLSELEQELEAYSLIAKADGSITEIEPLLDQGTVPCNTALIEETSSSGYYEAVCDDYNFRIGKSYPAQFGTAVYDMKVTSIKKQEGGTKIIFQMDTKEKEPVFADCGTMTLQKKKRRHVILLPAACIFTKGEKSYVKQLDENGFPYAVLVTVGENVRQGEENYVVIKKGLTGGEKIVVP